jgi:predicted transcriptional regulator
LHRDTQSASTTIIYAEVRLLCVRRGTKDIAAAVLEEVVKGPNLAPGRIFARAGTNYEFRKVILNNGLVEYQKTGKRNTRMRVTEKGRTFLQHYRVCNELLPA